MPLILQSVVRKMTELYSLPIGMDRFQCYLKLLQGDRPGDLILPIGAFNPMAKSHIAFQLAQIQEMRGEEVAQRTLAECAMEWNPIENWMYCINIADDKGGGWTNKFTTDFDLRFKYQALARRNMAMIVLWSSEEISNGLIESRTRQAYYRMRYWLNHGMPKTLRESLRQEAYVATFGKSFEWPLTSEERKYLEKNGESTEYPMLFSFLMGDAAGQLLGYPKFGFKGCLNATINA